MPQRDTQDFPAQKRPPRPREMQGEGNRDADLAYRHGLRKFIDAGRVEPAAARSLSEARMPAPPWWSDAHDAAWARGADVLSYEATPSVILGPEASQGALRYGVGAASFYRDCVEWSPRLAHLLREEWLELATGVDWSHAEPLIQRGWEWGRIDLARHQ